MTATKPNHGQMHVSPTEPDVMSVSHGEDTFTALPGTHVFEVPAHVGEHLVAFPHWRASEAKDYENLAEDEWASYGQEADHPQVTGRRAPARPGSEERRARMKAELRAELLEELRLAGILPSGEPTSEQPVSDNEQSLDPEDTDPDVEEDDEDNEEEPTPAPVRRPQPKTRRR